MLSVDPVHLLLNHIEYSLICASRGCLQRVRKLALAGRGVSIPTCIFVYLGAWDGFHQGPCDSNVFRLTDILHHHHQLLYRVLHSPLADQIEQIHPTSCLVAYNLPAKLFAHLR